MKRFSQNPYAETSSSSIRLALGIIDFIKTILDGIPLSISHLQLFLMRYHQYIR